MERKPNGAGGRLRSLSPSRSKGGSDEESVAWDGRFLALVDYTNAGFPGGGPGGVFSQVGRTLGNYHFAVSPSVFLYALLIAAALAIVASVLPAWYIARVRPAEVLRNE